MKILAVNPGSATLKTQLFDMSAPNDASADSQLVEAGPQGLLPAIQTRFPTRPAVDAVVCRVVHGGSDFVGPVRVDAAVLQRIDYWGRLAPLHNPIAAEILRYFQSLDAALPLVAVFDTAFPATLPPVAFTEAIPRELAQRHGLRRYGMHGISYQHVVRQMAEYLPEAQRLIVAHLGNGSSISAIRAGRCVDTSMGLTPLPGLIMGSRCGDLGPDVVLELQRRLGMNADEIENVLTRESGLKGLAGTADMRELLARDDEAAQLAVEMYCYRVRKYIGAYAAVLGGVDALVFTGGIGENSASVRARILEPLAWLGFQADPHGNEQPLTGDRVISAAGAKTTIWVIPADEEKEMARQAAALLAIGG
ncbi:MAG: acetate/propionate family kinase [Gemmataceae bacterium]